MKSSSLSAFDETKKKQRLRRRECEGGIRERGTNLSEYPEYPCSLTLERERLIEVWQTKYRLNNILYYPMWRHFTFN